MFYYDFSFRPYDGFAPGLAQHVVLAVTDHMEDKGGGLRSFQK